MLGELDAGGMGCAVVVWGAVDVRGGDTKPIEWGDEEWGAVCWISWHRSHPHPGLVLMERRWQSNVMLLDLITLKPSVVIFGVYDRTLPFYDCRLQGFCVEIHLTFP